MNTVLVHVLTPKKPVLETKANVITLPTYEGEISILPHHARLFALLKEGIIKIKLEEKEDFLAIGGGYVETDGEDVTALVSRAYGQNEIDIEQTEKALKQAQLILSQTKNQSERDAAMSLLRRSVIDMKLVKRRKRQTF